MSEDSFEQMLNESFTADAGISTGEKVEAKVVSIGKEHVYLDLGTRSEGMILREELEQDGEITVEVGDTLIVHTISSRDGAVMCATRFGAKADAARSGDKDEIFAQLKDAYESGIPVEGNVKEVNKGGFGVTIMGQLAFCPISQIARGFCEAPDEHLNKTYDFAVIKFEEGGRNIVISRRALLELEAEEAAVQAWQNLSEGDIIEGKVTSLQPYGAFVDIGGVDGLVHISEISYTRIDHPDEVLKMGQALKVQIKSLDHEKKKISLSLKSLMEDPWQEGVAALTAGAVHTGKVVRIVTFGAFIELSPGLEGLAHISQMSETKRVNNPREIVNIGDNVDVRILEIDQDARRVSLAIVDEAAEEERSATESFRQKKTANPKGMGTLGDLLASKLKKD